MSSVSEYLFHKVEVIINALFNLSNIANILTIITSLITICGIVYAWSKSRLKIYTQYILDNAFIDRKTALYEVSSAIREKDILVNIYGKKGVGKSNFLRFYCDLLNHKLTKKDKEILKKQFENKSEYSSLHSIRSKAFYIEISGYQSRSDLSYQISETITGKTDYSIIEVAEKLRKALLFHKKIIIIIDNVNTLGLETELENIIKLFYSVSPKFHFIIGSIRKLDLFGLLNTPIKGIELQNFKEEDIKEFIHHNYPVINCSILADILKLSEGLPILVNLYLKGFKEYGKLDNNTQVKKYVHQITENLPEKELQIAQVIALLSITKANIPIELLRCIMPDFNDDNIRNIENNALIEFHPIKLEIKMHEIFRDFINSFYFMNEQEYIFKIYKYFKDNSTEYESAYYAILMDDIKIKNLVIPTVEKAITNENFPFLLLFGEHIKNAFGLQLISTNISNEAFYIVILGYLEGLIGVGDYPAAKEIVDKCALTVRQHSSSSQLKLSLLIANLYHLQNQYQEAIASYEIILNEINSMKSEKAFCEYEAKCLWGIAHSYRHEGLKYSLAELYYREAIEAAQRTNQKSIILKSRFELVTIYVLQNNITAANVELDAIENIFNDIPTEKYIFSKIAYKKIRARYIRVFNIRTIENDLKLLMDVLREYELQKKRLQYNTFFDIGEYYRHHKQYTEAIRNYTTALNFSIKNHDMNLNTMSRLGIILCDISRNQSNNETIISLRDILKDSIEHNLYTNSIFAKLILDILQENKISQESQNNLRSIGVISKNNLIYSEYKDIDKIHLILM